VNTHELRDALNLANLRLQVMRGRADKIDRIRKLLEVGLSDPEVLKALEKEGNPLTHALQDVLFYFEGGRELPEVQMKSLNVIADQIEAIQRTRKPKWCSLFNWLKVVR
jgi:hypothetical protein